MAFGSIIVINESGNSGTDYPVYADIVAGQHIQGVKLIDSTEGSVLPIGISGNPIHITGSTTVSGTVAAAQSGTWNINNISGTVSLPTGAATAANQSTIIGHVDGIETLLGASNTNTGNAATALQIMDDWDETDRCKVNLIVGQAGVAGGSGTTGATTQRVTIATDDSVNNSLTEISSSVKIIDNIVHSTGNSLNQMAIIGGVEQSTIPETVKPIAVENSSDTPVNVNELTTAARGYRLGLGNQWRRARNQNAQLSVTRTTTGTNASGNNDGMGAQEYALQVKGTGAAPTAWTVELQVSLNNADWTTVLTHNTASGDGATVFLTDKSARYYRLNTTALTLGAATNIVINVIIFNKG